MKIGLIFCAFGTLDMLPESLAPWLAAKASRLGGHEFKIAAVSCPFLGFPDSGDDGTVDALFKQVGHEGIDHLVVSDTPVPETEARGRALRWLVDNGCEITWMVDADEFYTVDEISRITAFVAARPLIAAFKGSFRNCVFDTHTFLSEPFQPMRLHRVKHGSYVSDSFYEDNNVLYRGTITRDSKRDIDLPVGQIPKACAWVKHLTWISDDRSRKKVLYQMNRWGNCSFVWDAQENRLKFNSCCPEPEIIRE